MKTFVFLYTEIAEYFLSCIQALNNKEAEIHVIHWPVNEEAPYKFRRLENVHFHNREKLTEKELISLTKHISPDVIICSGWLDKGYIKTVSSFSKNTTTVVIFDNQWFGNLKQQIGRFLLPLYIIPKFSFAWVPGEPQYIYAQKMGFRKSKIIKGVLSADTKLFSELYNENKELKENDFPHAFLFAGRYIKEKNINLMCEAFSELQDENSNDWTLICAGAGELFDQRLKHPKIKHLGFVQPAEMGSVIKETGVFILASTFEPWGVVVHEFASAGYPLLCSKQTGAASEFLEEGKNGFRFDAKDKESIKSAMKQLMNMSDTELTNMSKRSRELSQKISPETWAETAMKIAGSFNVTKEN